MILKLGRRIENFTPVEASELRLTVPETIALPDIVEFNAFYIP